VWLDRQVECERLDRLLEAARAGESQALVVRGEPGVGKTALLDYLVGRATGFRVVRTAGVQSEIELAFAGLHQLCAPMLGHAERLPEPQRGALRTAFGLVVGPPPDQFMVGLAVLGLLAEVAADRPLLCVVDDAQWLDRASSQALALVARRLEAESVALVFGERTPSEAAGWRVLPQLALVGLPDDDARALLNSALPGIVDERVLDRIVAETRGNPLALLELPRGLTPAELAGGLGASQAALPQQIEDSYRQRLAALPTETQRLLLVAAAEPLGDPVLVWQAAQRLGVAAPAAMPAATAGLLDITSRVRFRHPLVRSAIYRAASVEERRNAHRALAEVTDPETDPDRRAWHAAQATPESREDIAAELEYSADRARTRGGFAAAAALLERAAELTPDPVRRAARALSAAQANQRAGAPDAALRLLSLAHASPLDEISRAKVVLLRGQIAFATHRGRDAPLLLLTAARQLAPLDVPLARETYLDALLAARFAGSLGVGDGVREVAEAARAAPPPPQPARAADLLLDALAVRYTDGYAAGAPTVKRALRAFRNHDISAQEGLRWFYLVCATAMDMWDDETAHVLSCRFLRLTRETGALTTLPLALATRVLTNTFNGNLTEAAAAADEQKRVTDASGIKLGLHGGLLLAAWQADEADAAELFDAVADVAAEAMRQGEGVWLTVAELAQALLCNGLGWTDDAVSAARRASEHPAVGLASWVALAELVEAATHSGQQAGAEDAFARLSTTTRASGTDWALGVEARCRALLTNGSTAEDAYAEAIDRLGRTRAVGDLARAHLLYGEWLRRGRRRFDARGELRAAQDLFTTMGAPAFVQRATRELHATGETARKRIVETRSDLTPQESQIVRLVRKNLSNSEIAARLFISTRTVEWHLSRIFTKLDVTSRRQL
jgi:DNA-binding CsgD family transcriptional regulator